MAIEANIRKRKHKAGAADEADEVVPKKIAKKLKQKTPKKTKNKVENNAAIEHEDQQHEQHMEDEQVEEKQHDVDGHKAVSDVEEPSQDSGFEPDEKEQKFSKDFKMMNFREKLRGNNFITELRHFLYLTHASPKIIAKYIEKRGKPLELAEALERIDKTNVLHVAYLCNALQLVVMEILTNQKSHMEPALNACRYFLKSHGAVVESLLKSSNLQHRRIALKLLTAIVCAEPQLGRQLLASYDILSNVKTIEEFLWHSRQEVDTEDTVRKCYIHFVLAYLVDGNTLLIRNILDRGTLIRGLATGLKYDDHVTVCVVLSTLKRYVLECAEISKSKKISVFDVECCKQLVRLYDWQGPKAFAAQQSGPQQHQQQAQNIRRAEKHQQFQNVQKLVDPQEAEAVAAAVHEFLLTLLTSRKHGITFDAMANFGQKHNKVQGKLMGFLYNPWCSELKTDLIVKVLQACPDLARNTIRHFGGILNPLRTPQRYLVNACNFLEKLITTLHPRLLRHAIDKITLTDYSHWIKDICLPLEVLVHITGSKALDSANVEYRLAINRLLLAMFTQYANYMALIAKREQSKGPHTLRRFKFDILNHILVNYPTVENLLISLNLTISAADESAVLQHLEVTLDLVLIICQEHRTFVNKTSTILDFLELLRPLYADKVVADVENAFGQIMLEIKAIKTILLLSPKALEPQQPLFGSVLRSLIKAFVRGSAAVQRDAGELLHGIFENTGLFEAGALEIDLWLEAMRFYDAQTVDVVTSVFIEVLQVTKAQVDAPKTTDIAPTNNTNLQQLFTNIEQGYSVQAYIETLEISKLLPLIYKGVEIVPPLDNYLETVCLLMFHYHPQAAQVQQLYTQQFKSQRKYMSSWLQQDVGVTSDCRKNKIASNVPLLAELQTTLLDGGQTFEEFFKAATTDAAECWELEFKGKIHKFNAVLRNERLILIYAQALMFQLEQLLAKQQLTRAQADIAASYLQCFVQLLQAKSLTEEENELEIKPQSSNFLNALLKYIYSVRISYISSAADIFNGAQPAQLNYLHFLSLLSEGCNNLPNFESYSNNYRLKLVKALAISMQHSVATAAQSAELTVALRLMRAMQLQSAECCEMLQLMSENLKYSDYFDVASGQKTFYHEVLVLLLQRLAALCAPVKCDNFIRRFGKIYQQFVGKYAAETEPNLEQLEEALTQFLQMSPQHIEQLRVSCFDALFVEKRKLTKASVRFGSLLLERDARFYASFKQHLPEAFARKELVYPLLAVTCAQQAPETFDLTLLTKIYHEYKNGFMRTIEKPQKAAAIYREHVESSLALVKHCMPRSECLDFCQKHLKFDVIETYQMQLISAIYQKAFDALEPAQLEQKRSIFQNFINLQIQMLCIELKKPIFCAQKLALFGYQLQQWFKQSAAIAPLDYAKILQSQQWLNYCKQTLKLGMQQQEALQAESEATEQQEGSAYTADARNGKLLALMAYLCEQLYVLEVEEEAVVDEELKGDEEQLPESEEPQEESKNAKKNAKKSKKALKSAKLSAAPIYYAEPAQLFEMIFSHSKFYDILLTTTATPTHIKTQVLHLLFVLAQKSQLAPLDVNAQIPAILGAYQARLSDADRWALALLQLYEQADQCSLQQYRPFIWGESAIAFYALRAADEERHKLRQQETSIAQVMSLIERQLCEYTIDNFPIWRKLHGSEQLPSFVFENPAEQAMHFGANALEQSIEQSAARQLEEQELKELWKNAAVEEKKAENQKDEQEEKPMKTEQLPEEPTTSTTLSTSTAPSTLHFSVDELRLCPKRVAVYAQCYDPAFMVPLLSMCFAPETYAHPARPVQNGALSVVFAALSSQDKQMRLAAACVQQRYRAHFENNKFFERPLWTQTYDNIQAGLSDLRDNWMKHKRNSGTPRVPYIAGLFVAKTFNLSSDPTHLLYKQLTMYLRLKSSFNFQTVPEFNVLFYSPEVEHHSFRQFIIEVIRCGIKSSSDLYLLLSTHTFKVLMGYYSSAMSTLDVNLQILSVFSTCVKIPAATRIMLEQVGVLPWLAGIIGSLEFYHFDIIEGLISILNNLWYAVRANATEFHNYAHICAELQRLLLLLLPHMSARIAPAAFAKLVNVLQKTASMGDSQHYLAMSATQLDHLLSCAERHFPTEIYSLQCTRRFGGAGVERTSQYCQRLHAQSQLDSVAILALSSLRAYLIGWWQCNEQQRSVADVSTADAEMLSK